MNPIEIISGFREFCAQNADPAIVTKYSRYFKDGYNGWGIPSGMFQAKALELLSQPGMDLELVQEMAEELVKSPKYEEVSLAILMTQKLHKSWTPDTFSAVEHWFSIGINNWAHTDYICGEIIPLFFKKKIIDIGSLREWRTADNKFQRRAAVVGLIKPMKLSADFKPFYEFIAPMMMDREREVHQGLGWFLREAWKKQPEPTEAFLMKWKQSAARLIFQYACEKMTKENRERFRKTK
jgi:3-methyladenine DNA glycosylase AlkD